MRLPRALYCKPDFRGLGNKFLLDIFLPSGAYFSPRLAEIMAQAPCPAALRFSPPEPLLLDWALVSDKRQHLPISAKQASDNPTDVMKLLVGLWEGKGLYECSLLRYHP